MSQAIATNTILMPQPHSRAGYEIEVLTSIATLFAPANTQEASRVRAYAGAKLADLPSVWEWQGPNADSRPSQQGINAMPRCQWYEQHRDDGCGHCLDCGSPSNTRILATWERNARRIASTGVL